MGEYEFEILSLSLQLCSSLMLGYSLLKKISYDDLKNTYSLGIWMDSTNNPDNDIKSKWYKKNPVNTFLSKIILGRLSLFYLFFGFLLSIFGDTSGYVKKYIVLDIIKTEIVIGIITLVIYIIWNKNIKYNAIRKKNKKID